MKKPIIDLGECVICEICQEVCPEVFKLNELGYIEMADLAIYPEECVDEAVRNCPCSCISWESE
ncbi:MAG: ferredoxin [Desulfobacterales bacterium]